MTIYSSLIDYYKYQERLLKGRYINLDHLKEPLLKHSEYFKIEIIGSSVFDEDIHFIEIGTGKRRVLMWSQMHGNESTTTKAVFDLLNLLSDVDNKFVQYLLQYCTIGIIPMLNPDGARVYSRFNANHVDLNRDAKNLSQPESKILRTCFEHFQPDFCFNLHGQRTIFSVGETPKSATVSFSAPAEDEQRSVTDTRRKAMEIIVKMNQELQNVIPGHVGIYDDFFNINCVGDTFQSLGVPTILFEAGHFPDDYIREKVRELIFNALWVGLCEVAYNDIKGSQETAYFKIPENRKLFYDIVIRNAKIESDEGDDAIKDIAVQYEERLDQDHVIFIPKIAKISDLRLFFGHKEIDASNQELHIYGSQRIQEGLEIDFVVINDKPYSLKLEKK